MATVVSDRTLALDPVVTELLRRWPTAGVAVAVVRQGRPVSFLGRGVADVESRAPVTEDTVFRIASITKTMTAVAVMQLWERGRVDLDAPANDYLRAFRLTPADPAFRPATVRHLLTHTAGVGYFRRLSDVVRPLYGSGDAASSVPRLADYYGGRLLVEVEPGTKWVYSNHGFAALGQIVEDVTGESLDRYLRGHLFEPLGMTSTDLVRSEHIAAHVATGYVLRAHGLKRVPWREVPTPGGGGVYSTARDLATYVGALLAGGANEHGRVLRPETVETMFRPHFRPDPRLPGMGLGFELDEEDGHPTVHKGGTLSGFLSTIDLVPDRGLGLVVLANTGGLDNRGIAEPLAGALVRRLLDLPTSSVRSDIAPRPEVWHELCGWYGPPPGRVTNLFLRMLLGAGVEVRVRDRRLVMQPLTPVPALRKGFVLHPDDPVDPRVFRVKLPELGMTLRVVFTDTADDGRPRKLFFDLMELRKRPDRRNPRPWVTGLAAGAVVALALRRRSLRRLQARALRAAPTA